MSRRNGHLKPRHLAVLFAVQRLQPCSPGKIAREIGEDVDFVENTVYRLFSRLGLAESAIIRIEGKLPRRKTGTLRLTPEGERLANQC